MNRSSTCAGECALVHLVNNKLGIITATCDLLLERATDPEVVAWLRVIEAAAKALADEFNKPLSRTQGA